jgi:squalene synthase HpnC
MPVDHYENFPVASILLPKAVRRPTEVIYAFARSADDIADEGDAAPAERLAALDAYLAELDRIEAGETPQTPLFVDVAGIVARHRLPVPLFRDLISAFKQDVTVKRYETSDDLADYCSRSANPVGRLMLILFNRATPQNIERSDAVCTALQLINFWQDVAIDWQKDRVYLPQADLRQYRVSEAQIAAGHWTPAWAALIDFEIDRARRMMLSGGELARELPGRFGWEIRFTVLGGLRILEKLQRVRGNVFARRPVLKAADWPMLGLRALAY